MLAALKRSPNDLAAHQASISLVILLMNMLIFLNFIISGNYKRSMTT